MSRRAADDDTTGRSRLERLFFAASALPPEQQERWVDSECASDPEMAASLRKLLCAGRASAASWTAPVWAASGLRFGPYHVTGHIGSGGMGVVYSALRDDAEFRKKVAIKAIPPSLVTESGALALRQERQILALLEHPNIARLLDGGTTEYGVPFLVMEYIEGLPLLVYAREHELGTAQRLALFVSICDGVAYAHRNLVIHRDLKPSNILVTGDGTPKLLDFGIARLLDRSGEVTLWNARFMTPDFASPEQLLGQRMTTASDIYSLGVLLFVLLTGQPASDLPQARPALRDDLGNIVAMALRADPRDRYSSVEQFAADIRRYLGGLPVRAHRPTFPYRSGKFISRHRIGLAAVLAVAVSLAAAAGFQLRAYHATRRHYDEAMRLAASFAFEVPDAIARTPGTLSARQLIVQRATGYLDDLSREAGRDPSLESELAAAYDRIGSLTFQVEGALALHRKALAIGRRLAWNDPGNPKFLERLSASYGLVGDGLREEGDSTGALENYRNAMNAMKPLARTNPAGLADTYVEMGMMLTRIGRFDEGLAYDAKVMAIRRALLNAAPADIENRRAWIDTRIWMALGMLAAGKVAPALESADAAYRDAESMGAADPANPVCRRHRWVARMIRARALGIRGDFAGAAGEYRRALDLIQSLAESDPGDKGHRRSMAVTWLGLADALAAQGRRSDAERWYARAIAESEKLLREDPRKLETAIDLGRMYSHLGSLYVKTARVSEARAFLEKGRGLIDAASARDPQDAALRSDRTEAYAILGKLR